MVVKEKVKQAKANIFKVKVKLVEEPKTSPTYPEILHVANSFSQGSALRTLYGILTLFHIIEATDINY